MTQMNNKISATNTRVFAEETQANRNVEMSLRVWYNIRRSPTAKDARVFKRTNEHLKNILINFYN